MPITYQHMKTGRMVKVLTPEERAARSGSSDRALKRQRQIIAKMDQSQKWTRAATPPLLGRRAKSAPVVDDVPRDLDPIEVDSVTPPYSDEPDPESGDEGESTPDPTPAPDPEPEAKSANDGPRFTRVVKRT